VASLFEDEIEAEGGAANPRYISVQDSAAPSRDR
jgi:hypothetical protein